MQVCNNCCPDAPVEDKGKAKQKLHGYCIRYCCQCRFRRSSAAVQAMYHKETSALASHAVTCNLNTTGIGDEGSQPEREFAYYPRLTAMSSMYPDEADAAQATFSLVLNRPQSFSLLEDLGKMFARYGPLQTVVSAAAAIGFCQ